ncbi:MAG: helix-turn-helix transcriptional regulator [Elusimicrobia bacterium]|nr:helix-turn-helix transcriptional regulator [Elusimicrobiota bacterium]
MVGGGAASSPVYLQVILWLICLGSMASDSEKIRKWLKKKGLTYEKFAYQVGISWSTVARWAGGKVKPDPIYLEHVKRNYPDFPL